MIMSEITKLKRILAAEAQIKGTRLRPRKRDRRCYELTWKYHWKLNELGYSNWRTVHGELYCIVLEVNPNKEEFMRHGWLTSGKVVYDPVLDRVFDAGDFKEMYDPNNCMTYTVKQFEKELEWGGGLGYYGQ